MSETFGTVHVKKETNIINMKGGYPNSCYMYTFANNRDKNNDVDIKEEDDLALEIRRNIKGFTDRKN